MFESKVMEESGALTGDVPQTAREREALLAALAATLVEYRRHVDSEDGDSGAPGRGGSWRTLARWEQLQGQA
jgi:hypothetical protein